MTQNEIISGLKNSLGVVKNPYTFVKLAIKHALLIAVISSIDKYSLLKQKSYILDVHHRNVSLAIQCHKHFDPSGIFSCILSLKKQRSNVLSVVTIAIMVAWWVFEMKISLDRQNSRINKYHPSSMMRSQPNIWWKVRWVISFDITLFSRSLWQIYT